MRALASNRAGRSWTAGAVSLLGLFLAGCSGPALHFTARTPVAVEEASVNCRSGSVRHMLLLSSGGADGAFGAGVLGGWTASGLRPKFDVVTGVSTGALQATSAFLGSDQDEVLKRVYTTLETRDVLRSNGPLAAVLGSGLYRLSPLRRRLYDLIDEALLERVAREHERGRRLYVGTTDLTRGRMVIWDMGAIAASRDPDRRSQYVGVLLASAAVPGIIEPIRVTSRDLTVALHGDGATKAPLLFHPLPLPSCARLTEVWIIANGHVSTRAATLSQKSGTIAMARRGVSQLMRRFLHTTVRVAAFQAQRAGSRLRLLSLPETIPEAASPFAFRRAEMRRLYDAGVRLGADGRSWAEVSETL